MRATRTATRSGRDRDDAGGRPRTTSIRLDGADRIGGDGHDVKMKERAAAAQRHAGA